MVEPMDCSILKTSFNGVTLGFKFGAFFIGVGPEVTGLLPVWLTPAYANPAFISNSIGLR